MKAKADAIMESIRRILFDDWDPIGVNDSVSADEYDSYIAGVYRLLTAGASQTQISEHLRQIEVTKMGLTGNPKHRTMVADKLRKLDVS